VLSVPALPFAETFTILTRGVTGQDSDGNDVYGDVPVSTSGAFAPTGSTELIQGQNTVIENDTIYLADGQPTPKPTDRIRRELTGDLYDIDGKPGVFLNPFTGDQPGAVLRLERVTG
jgi:hypothetical protein